MKRSLLMSVTAQCILLGLMALPASAAKEPKHAAPVQCNKSVDEFLHDVAGEAKNLSVSPSLTPQQYAVARKTVKEGTKDHLDIPGDGAIIIASDKGFALLFTKGTGDDIKMCSFMGAPAQVIADILGVELPKSQAPADKTTTDKAPDGELRV